MALSPGIPTSFVPKQPTQQTRKQQSSGFNTLLLISLFIGGLALVATAGTFAYDRYLKHQLTQRAEALAAAKSEVNQDQVEEFVRLRDRLSYGQDLLNNHVALSQVFDALESSTLSNVRFRTLSLVVANDNTARLDIEGTARTFNALAAQSNAFAGDKRIRRAIFSGITVNKDNSVNFKLTAELDSKLIVSQRTTAPALLVPSDATPPPAATTTLPAATSTTSRATTTQSTSTQSSL